MALDVPFVPAQIPRLPVTVTPEDLQPLVEKVIAGFEEGIASDLNVAQMMEARTTGLEATKSQNQAKTATAKQDVIDQQGAPQQPQQSAIARLFGSTQQPQAPASSVQRSGLQHMDTSSLTQIVTGAGYSVE